MRHVFLSMIGVGVVLVLASTAQAQFPQYPSGGVGPPIQGSSPLPPTVSPYLNLLRGGNPAANYFNGVRPAQQFAPSFPQQSNSFGQRGQVPGGFFPLDNPDLSGPYFEQARQPAPFAAAGSYPVVYGNQFGNHGSYFSVYAQNVNRASQSGSTGSGFGSRGNPALGRPSTPRR